MGVFVLVVLVDYIEMTRKTSGIDASTWLVVQTSLFRVPQLLERLMPFCVLVAAMSCYLNLSRRLELVVARSAGVSAWQFLTPALASCARHRRAGDDDLQSGFGQSAGAGAAERDAAVRRPHADDAGRAGLLAQSGDQRRADDHQRGQQPAPRRTAVGTDRFPVRSDRAGSASGSRRAKRRWRTATGCSRTCAATPSTNR